MPTKFTTYFMSSFHGMEIEWNHDPNAAVKNLDMKLTLNWYSSKVYVDARSGGRIDMSTTTTVGNLASAASKEYELREAVVFSETNATDGTVKCANSGAVGTQVCYDGFQAYLICDAKYHDSAFDDGTTKWNSVNCKMVKQAVTTTYDLAPVSATDVNGVDPFSPTDKTDWSLLKNDG